MAREARRAKQKGAKSMSTARDRPPEEAHEDTSFARGLRVLLTIADRGEIRPIDENCLELRRIGESGHAVFRERCVYNSQRFTPDW